MSTANLNPLTSATPEDKGSLYAAIQFALRQYRMNDDNFIPAKIVTFDRTNNWATVQPLIKFCDVQGTWTSRPQLVKIQVLSLGGGGFHISFPLNPGDLGWLCASDRDISLYQQSLAESESSTGRMHQFADGMFIPDVLRKYTLNSSDNSNMVIQTTDGTTRISINEGNINLYAPTKVLVTTPLAEFTSNVQIDGNLEVKGNAAVDQNLTVTQVATVTGMLNANGGLTIPPGKDGTLGGLSLVNHTHTSTTPGTQTSTMNN